MTRFFRMPSHNRVADGFPPDEAEMPQAIPRTVFQTHKSRAYVASTPDLRGAVESWETLPRSTHRFDDDAAARRTVAALGAEYAAAYDSYPLGVMRADMWRVAVVFLHGGWYVDADAHRIPGADLPPNVGFGAVFTFENETHICNMMFGAVRGHPVLRTILELMVRRSTLDPCGREHFVHHMTGPGCVTDAMCQYFGVRRPADVRTLPSMRDVRLVAGDGTLFGVARHLYAGQAEDGWLRKVQAFQRTCVPAHGAEALPILWLTWKDRRTVPDHVMETFRRTAAGYDIRFYDDAMCKEFIRSHEGDEALAHYNRIHDGAHRADLWRYIALYHYGGVYLDIKIRPRKHLDTIFTRPLSYTVFSTQKGTMFNAVIRAQQPRMPIFRSLIDRVLRTDPSDMREDYLLLTRQFHDELFDAFSPIALRVEGLSDWAFLREVETPELGIPCTTPDRYGFCYCIVDEKDEILFDSRYTDFPWQPTPRCSIA